MSILDKYFGMENPKYSVEQRRYMKRFANKALPVLIFALIFNIVFIVLVLRHTIDFSKFGKTRAQDLPDLQSRIGFVLKYATPGALWLFLCIYATIRVRVRSPAMDPLNNQEHILVKVKNILQNSLEQFILSLMAQLILVTYLNASETLKYIPALSLTFITGRITFWLGYPQYRSFGFITTLMPTMVTLFYVCYRFVGLYF